MNIWTVRQATLADAVAIAAMLQKLNWFPQLNAESPEQVVKHVEQQMLSCHGDPSHSIYVAEGCNSNVLGNILGYAAVHWLPYLFLPAPEGYVSELFVHSNHYGQGIGQALLQAVIAEATDRGCSRLMLVNGKDRDSYQRQFYVKQGWQEREHVANFVYPLPCKNLRNDSQIC